MTPHTEALEDDFSWVLRKALKAREMAPSRLAELAGIEPREVLAFSRGQFSEQTARRIAPHLDLGPEAFANHPRYRPKPDLPAGLERLAFSFDDGLSLGMAAASSNKTLPLSDVLKAFNRSLRLFPTAMPPFSCPI